MTENEEVGLGLAGEHNYAVLDLKERGEYRYALIKNPWSKGTVWKGVLPGDDIESGNGDAADQGVPTKLFVSNLHDASSLGPGIFWMDFDSIFQSFESLYLNWNPALFPYREDIHFFWDLRIGRGAPGCFFGNPQYAVRTRAAGIVWLLLSRHIRTTRSSGEADLSRRSNANQHDLGFISLYAFEYAGQRIFQSDGASHRGPYVDSPNTLLRIDAALNTDYTIVISEQSIPESKHNFTLTALSLKPLTITPAVEKYTSHTEHEGAWTPSSAGGNANAATYGTNPQFLLQIPSSTDLALLLETSNEDLSVNVKLIWAGGKRVTGINTRDIAADSGEYRRGCALVEIRDVRKGDYTMVCSTFEAGQIGRFVLRTCAEVAHIVKPVPVEGAGRFRSYLPPAHFPPGVDRVLAPLATQRITILKVIARHQPQAAARRTHPNSPLKVSLELGQGPNKTILAVSSNDEFSDSPAGIRTHDVDVRPELQMQGGLWLVIERLGGSGAESEEEVNVELLSEGPVDVGHWGSGSG